MRGSVICLAVALVAAMFLTGCTIPMTAPTMGGLYTGIKLPVSATANTIVDSPKMGEGQCISVLGLIAVGDASIQTAARSAGITKVHYVDSEIMSILGFFAIYKVYVYGE